MIKLIFKLFELYFKPRVTPRCNWYLFFCRLYEINLW